MFVQLATLKIDTRSYEQQLLQAHPDIQHQHPQNEHSYGCRFHRGNNPKVNFHYQYTADHPGEWCQFLDQSMQMSVQLHL